MPSPSPQPDPWLSLPREGVEDPQSQGVGAAVSQCQQHSAALSPGTWPRCPELPWLLQHTWKACLLGPDAVTMLTENREQPLARHGLRKAGMKSI